MIRVSLAVLVFLYLFVFIMAVFAVWALEERRRQRRARIALQNRVHCSVCAYDFEDASLGPLSVCPRCGTTNERQKPSKI